MIQKLKSMKANQKGFTLAELLIVVAILAVLAAIAVPIFSVQLDKTRQQVDAANLRSAISMAEADFLAFGRKAETPYYFSWNEEKKSLGVAYSDKDAGTLATSAPSDAIKPQSSSTNGGKGTIVVTIDGDGSVKNAVWSGT